MSNTLCLRIKLSKSSESRLCCARESVDGGMNAESTARLSRTRHRDTLVLPDTSLSLSCRICHNINTMKLLNGGNTKHIHCSTSTHTQSKKASHQSVHVQVFDPSGIRDRSLFHKWTNTNTQIIRDISSFLKYTSANAKMMSSFHKCFVKQFRWGTEGAAAGTSCTPIGM